jgi:hypothetical protein
MSERTGHEHENKDNINNMSIIIRSYSFTSEHIIWSNEHFSAEAYLTSSQVNMDCKCVPVSTSKNKKFHRNILCFPYHRIFSGRLSLHSEYPTPGMATQQI